MTVACDELVEGLACGVAAVGRCNDCLAPRCPTHLTVSVGPDGDVARCAACQHRAAQQSQNDREMLNAALTRASRSGAEAIRHVISALNAAGSPGLVEVTRPEKGAFGRTRHVKVGLRGYPVGRIRAEGELQSGSQGTSDSVRGESFEAYVTTDGAVRFHLPHARSHRLRPADGGLSQVIHELTDLAIRHGVPLG